MYLRYTNSNRPTKTRRARPEPSSLHSSRWKLWTALPTTVFLASTCGYTFQDNRTPHCRANTATRAPSSPELRRHLSFATRTPSSPELRRRLTFTTRAPPSPEFTFHQSFVVSSTLHQISVVTRASRPEIHLFQSSIFDRASSSPALRDHSSSCTEIRRHLSSPELRDQSSTFVRAPPST